MARIAILIFVFLFGSIDLSAQVSQKIIGSSISGVIVRGDTGEPIENANVELRLDRAVLSKGEVQYPTIASTTTGVIGEFHFRDVAPDKYRLFATANGFAKQEYGQKTANSPGIPVILSEGQTLDDISFALVASGTVIGRIMDSSGHPVALAQVQLLSGSYNASGEKIFRSERQAETNDRGDYRIYSVPQGSYYLVVGRPFQNHGGIVPNGASPNMSINRAIYYPGSDSIDDARMIEVGPMAEMVLNLQLTEEKLYVVRGKIIDAQGSKPPKAVSIELGSRSLTGSSFVTAQSGKYFPATGEFEIRDVGPGTYIVQAVDLSVAPPNSTTPTSFASRSIGQVLIQVRNHDTDGLEVSLSRGSAISGQVFARDLGVRDLSRMRVQLRPRIGGRVISSGPSPAPAAVTKPDGSFLLEGVRAGEYLLSVSGLPAGVYISSASYGTADILNNPFEFKDLRSDVVVIHLGSDTVKVAGRVVDAKMVPRPESLVVFVPVEQLNRVDLYRTATTNQSGEFSIDALPPLRYRIFAWEALPQFAYFDPNIIEEFAGSAQLFQASTSGVNMLTVELIPSKK